MSRTRGVGSATGMGQQHRGSGDQFAFAWNDSIAWRQPLVTIMHVLTEHAHATCLEVACGILAPIMYMHTARPRGCNIWKGLQPGCTGNVREAHCEN